MFDIHNFPTIDERFLLIDRDLKVLHFDEEPILFTGLTSFDYRVLASLVDEDQDEQGNWFARYFYIILNHKQYADFLSKRISYLQAIQDTPNVFILDKFHRTGVTTAFKAELAQIPSEYWPTEESFCPSTDSPFGLRYLVSLKGQLADRFYAVSTELSGIQESFSSLLSNAALIVQSFCQEVRVYQSAYVPSSFQMSFDVVPATRRTLFLENEKVTELYNSIVNYCIDGLPSDIEVLFGEDATRQSVSFNQLKGQILELYTDSLTPVPDNLDQLVKSSLHKVLYNLEGITKNMGNNYDRLDIFNKLPSGESVTIGELDLTDREAIEDSVLLLESIEDVTVTDTQPRQYEIHIYSLNVDSKKGKAIIRDNSPNVSKPRIRINSTGSIEGTQFTSSMHSSEYIWVTATGKWQNGRCISLEIDNN